MFKVFRYFVDSVTVSYNTYRRFVPRDGHSNTFMSERKVEVWVQNIYGGDPFEDKRHRMRKVL